MVWDNVDSVLAHKQGVCTCAKCRTDIVACALNKLKPRYVSTDKGQVLAKAEYLGDDYMNVLVALIEAIEIVAANPHHNTD